MKKEIYPIRLKRLVLLLTILATSPFIQAQTINSSTILTPVCSGGSGTVELDFVGATYPFTLTWYGGNINNGSAVITSSPQIITIQSTSSSSWSNDGYHATFFAGNSNLGRYPVGITFDQTQTYIKATCATGATIAINNITGGSSPYTISLIDKTTSNTLASGSSPLNIAYSVICPNSGNLRLRVSDANGCSVDIDSLGVDCNGLTVVTSTTDASCTNGTATVTSVTGGVAPYTYQWANGATSSSITGLVQGSYNCIVTDANGCSGQGYSYVRQNPTIGVNFTRKNATCNNADGEATAFASGGTSPYTYLWSNGSTNQTTAGLPRGSHSVKITDANSCIATRGLFLNSTSPVYVSISNVTSSSCTSPTGAATLSVSGGQSPYTYQWDGNTSTTNTASGLEIGTHGFSVTDANGCERKGSVRIGPISNLNASISKVNAICPSNNGSASISATTTANPLTYAWSNGATTAAITGVPAGSYTCIIKDANNCEVSKSAYISSKSPIRLGFNSTIATCIFNADGSITANPAGGTAPYTYKWSTGATTATLSGVATGKYYVTATDANGCTKSSFVNLGYNKSNNSCYCTVDGTIYEDLNSNCIQDAGDLGISDVSIKLTGTGITSTNYNGYYSFKVPVGNYTLEEITNNGLSLPSCQTNNIAINIASVSSGCRQTNDFANKVTPLHDIHIYNLNANAPVPGNTYNQKIIIKNRGNINEANIAVGYKNDGQLTWQNNNAVPLTNAGTNYYQMSSININKGKAKTYWLDYYTPTNIPMGTSVYFLDSAAYQSPVKINWITNEETPWNNLHDITTIVRSSYDPNFKEVAPKGLDEDGKIKLNQTDFRYVVHFENNGTAPAQKVVIVDTLDANLKLSSFRTLNSSHDVVAHVDESGVLTFTFDNINLDYTPKNVYKASAQGHVAFTISANSTVDYGDAIKNKADIYFDYNEPITTNTVTNTYYDFTKGVQRLDKTAQIVVYPNPSSDIVTIKANNAINQPNQVSIFNMQGQLVKQVTLSNNTLDVSAFSKGVYMLQFYKGNNVVGSSRILVK